MFPRCILAAAVGCCILATLHAGDGAVLDTMDALRFHSPKEKGKVELVEGKVGKANRFAFAKDARSVFFTSNLHGTPAWDKAAGLSFWVKGDGSDACGALQLIYDDDFAVRYDFAFPIKSTEWTKVTAAWTDFIPVLPGPKAKPLDSAHGNRPSKISALWFGKWWYWGDYPAYSFAVDDLRLEPKIERDADLYRPAGKPLERMLKKLKAGEPVTIVTMGDSLTDFKHWANRKTAWPVLLRDGLQAKYKSVVTLHNPAIGGTQLRQNLVLLPRWLAQAPAPDLATVCFGGNDWESGMRGGEFLAANVDAIDQVRRATHGKADVLLLTTVPSLAKWTALAELADAGRKAATERNAGLADTEKVFLTAGKTGKERLFVSDGTHLSSAGHELVAATVLAAIESAGR